MAETGTSRPGKWCPRAIGHSLALAPPTLFEPCPPLQTAADAWTTQPEAQGHSMRRTCKQNAQSAAHSTSTPTLGKEGRGNKGQPSTKKKRLRLVTAHTTFYKSLSKKLYASTKESHSSIPRFPHTSRESDSEHTMFAGPSFSRAGASRVRPPKPSVSTALKLRALRLGIRPLIDPVVHNKY